MSVKLIVAFVAEEKFELQSKLQKASKDFSH